VSASNAEAICALRAGERGSFVFLINYHEYPLQTEVVTPGGRLPGQPTVPARSGLILPLDLFVCRGLSVEWCTLALLDLVETESEVVLRLGREAGAKGAVRLRGDLRELVLEGGKLRVQRGRDGRCTVHCSLLEEEATLRVRLRPRRPAPLRQRRPTTAALDKDPTSPGLPAPKVRKPRRRDG
jgi:hypothetical protein